MSMVAHSDPPPGDSHGDTTDAGPRGGPTVVRMMLGTQLRRLREAAGISPEQAGYEIRASRSKISRMEHGRVSFKDRDVSDLLTLYGVSDERVRSGLLALVTQANSQGWWAKYGDILPDWFEAYLGLEEAASLIRTFEVQFVHGLFQTEGYARAVTALDLHPSAAEEIDRRVSLRMARQSILTAPNPPQIWSILDEAVLRRPFGGPDVMRGQIEHLRELTELRHVTIQVVPFDRGGHAAAGGAFTLLRFAGPDLPDVVYIEQLTSALYLEERRDVDHYIEVMNHLSAEALTPADTVRFLTSLIERS